MSSRRRIGIVRIFIITVLLTNAIVLNAADVGPDKGALVLIGGGMRGEAIVKRFVDLAGGPGELIVVIPTAGGAENYDEHFAGLRQFRATGAKNVMVLHTYDRAVADSEKFVEPLRRARGVFFSGGRQWRLADAYLNTRTHRELRALLDRGGVIAGTSAGATILGSFLVRGDTKGNEVMIGDHRDGFGFLRNVAVDQHLLRRNRQFDMLEVIEAQASLLGVGIDEDTAIVVQQDQFEVIGDSYVVIYDNQRHIPPRGPFYFLAQGDRYNLSTREPSRPTQTNTLIERVKQRGLAK
jgi:cyanophycinase